MTLFRRTKTLTINEPDPEYNVVYLGNVLTVLAKGDGCVDKPLSLIWRAYNARIRSDLTMKLRVTKSGLKATTKEQQQRPQDSTEYWAHRITYCVASSEYPRLFAWVYKHEGAKPMKPELRCHAVLCKKLEQAQALAVSLAEKLSTALQDYRREKISRQNTRLSNRVTGAYPSIPLRKQMLNTAAHNFRPPLHRCRSAPRLDSIDENEEAVEEIQQASNITGRRRPFAFRLSVGTECRSRTLTEGDDDDDDDENSIIVPGTPTEIEFDRNKTSSFRVNLEIGNDVDKLSEDTTVRKYLCRDEADDSISDESGYGEEKASSLEDYDPNENSDEDLSRQITSL